MKLIISIILVLLTNPLAFASDYKDDSFGRFKNEVFQYLEIDTTWISIFKADDEEMIYEYESHKLIKQFCDYEFYTFQEGSICFHCTKHIAMIDNEKHTIAFLDTLLLSQTLDSINNVLKNCEQRTTPKQLNDFFDNIKWVYQNNKMYINQLRDLIPRLLKLLYIYYQQRML